MTVKSICEYVGLSSDFTATVENTYSEKKASDFNQDGINNRANTSWKRAANIIVSFPPDSTKENLLERWKILTNEGKYVGQYLYYPISNEEYEMYDCHGKLVDTGSLEDILEKHKIGKRVGLEQIFKSWLRKNGVQVAAKKYVDRLRAMGEPLSLHTATGRWPGFFEYLTGKIPSKGVYEVTSLQEFDAIYGEIKDFFYTEDQTCTKYGANYAECHMYSHNPTGGDQRFLLNAYKRYREFLASLSGDKYLAAIRTKPFILLAGISGTGKSRMVRQLARGCCPRFKSGTDEDHPLYDEQKPGNFEMIPVRPNWHDSTELMGYVSRISGSPKYVITDFIRFLAKAWLYEKEGIPFFLCLDEMNLAPVEQYFAEFLSVIETRKKDTDGRIVTDTLVKISDEPLLKAVIDDVYKDVEHNTAEKFKAFFVSKGGLPIPSNLVVIGTVNMDETTCTFSRKVLDRAMSFELNDVSDMYDLSNIDGEGDYEFGSIDSAAAKQSLTTGKEACDTAKDICGKVLGYLKAVNEKLDKTAFKIAYRSRNEIMIYCLERINGDVVSLAEALDEATSMKILSRIEGDSQHVTEKWLGELSELISAELAKVDGYDESKCNICRDKLNDMKEQVQSGYTSFWMR